MNGEAYKMAMAHPSKPWARRWLRANSSSWLPQKRTRVVTDQLDIARLCEEFDAPAMLGGNTFDGVVVDDVEFRLWKMTPNNPAK